MPFVIAIVVIAIAAAVVVIVRGHRRPRQDAGMQSFRRHIDALSPEARREVIDRARKHDEDRN